MPVPDGARALELATAVGENAFAVFGGLLVVLLLLVGVGWLAVGRVASRRVLSSAPRWHVSSATWAPALAMILTAALLFMGLAYGVARDGPLNAVDQALTRAVHASISHRALQVLALVTVLANTPVLWALGIAGGATLAWRRHYLLACIWLIAIGGNGILTRVLKGVFARERPPHDGELINVEGFGFPSGHSSGAVVAYGMLAYVLLRFTPERWHLPIVLSAATVAFIVGCSRILLQVHYASDVLAGFASGLAWLTVCVLVAEAGRHAAGRRRDEAF